MNRNCHSVLFAANVFSAIFPARIYFFYVEYGFQEKLHYRFCFFLRRFLNWWRSWNWRKNQLSFIGASTYGKNYPPTSTAGIPFESVSLIHKTNENIDWSNGRRLQDNVSRSISVISWKRWNYIKNDNSKSVSFLGNCFPIKCPPLHKRTNQEWLVEITFTKRPVENFNFQRCPCAVLECKIENKIVTNCILYILNDDIFFYHCSFQQDECWI